MERKGFTIMEVLIYIAIASILMLGLSSFMISISETRQKSKIIEEVESQGFKIIELISRRTRLADAINSPSVGGSSDQLSLSMPTPSQNPTVFSLGSDKVVITEAGNPSQELSNSLVNVSNLYFQNLSRPSTPGVVKISFTVAYQNNSGKQVFDYQKVFETSVSLR